MSTTALTIATRTTPTNREKLLTKKANLAGQLATVDEALRLLDGQPEVEKLADALVEALKNQDY